MTNKILVFILLLITVAGFTVEKNPYFRFSKKSKIDLYSKGGVNWSKGYFIARADKEDLSEDTREKLDEKLKTVMGKEKIEQELLQEAKRNLLNIVLDTKVDSYNRVRDLFNDREDFKVLFLEEVEKHIIKLPAVYLGSGQIESVVKYPIYGPGSLSDLVFQLFKFDTVVPVVSPWKADHSMEPRAFSSIIIDLRTPYKFIDRVFEKINLPHRLRIPVRLRAKFGYERDKKRLYFKGNMSVGERIQLLKLSRDEEYQEMIHRLYKRSQSSETVIKYSPSLFPSIYDSEGHLIFSKDMVEKELRPKIQYMKYTKDPLIPYKIEVVGENPLYVLADKVKGENNSNIVIHSEDARRLFLDPKTMKHL
ncbi:MAG TPA: hypothetical protein ENI73_04050, partial [Spirochaetes bacterium]|nr:hypothetical protein [Spirochaetota bacterium]